MSPLIFTIFFSFLFPVDIIDLVSERDTMTIESHSKYKVGQSVKCSNFENDSYWEGDIVMVLKDVLYKVELKKVYVNGAVKLYLNPSDCTGQKRLSLEDGKGYNETNIWIHERCID